MLSDDKELPVPLELEAAEVGLLDESEADDEPVQLVRRFASALGNERRNAREQCVGGVDGQVVISEPEPEQVQR